MGFRGIVHIKIGISNLERGFWVWLRNFLRGFVRDGKFYVELPVTLWPVSREKL
jgi:hypothetical protein